ncbi:MAG: hypothetical protein Q9217_004909 [Psora testacea]
MSSASASDPNIDRILTFWFDDQYPVTRWFFKSEELDNQIKNDFGNLVEKSRTTAELDRWAEKPEGALALIILLDQFSRNIYRGSPNSYGGDSKALNIAVAAIAKRFDRQLSSMQQTFFYLPFMHDENMISQIAARALYEGLATRCESDAKANDFVRGGVGFCQQHMDVISRFGRFPARNVALGRKSTDEEIAFLKEHPMGL